MSAPDPGHDAEARALLRGEGTDLAMAEAYVLAAEPHRANSDHRQAFRRHEERLRLFLQGKQEGARRFASSFAPKTTAGLWFRNQASKLLRFPSLAHYLIGRDLQDDLELPALDPSI